MAHMWICGEVSVNHRCLSEFRVNSGEFLDGLLTDTVTAMIHSNVVSYNTVAQDGMRVRASAGTSSFRRAPTLKKLKTEVKAFVDQLSGRCRFPALNPSGCFCDCAETKPNGDDDHGTTGNIRSQAVGMFAQH